MEQKRVERKGATALANILVASASLFVDAKTFDLIIRKYKDANAAFLRQEQLVVDGTILESN